MALHVVPPSLDAMMPSVPLETVRSALTKPDTASENVTVTSAVAPAPIVPGPTNTVAVGRTVLTV